MADARPSTAAHILIKVAAYLDIDDRRHGISGSEVQEDLQVIARWLTEHPDIDRQICTTLPSLEKVG